LMNINKKIVLSGGAGADPVFSKIILEF